MMDNYGSNLLNLHIHGLTVKHLRRGKFYWPSNPPVIILPHIQRRSMKSLHRLTLPLCKELLAGTQIYPVILKRPPANYNTHIYLCIYLD